MSDDRTPTALVQAIHAHSVVDIHGGDATDPEARRAVEACVAIGRRMREVADEVVALLEAHGVAAVDAGGDTPRQRHTTRIEVSGVDAARETDELLTSHGWFRHPELSPGARRSSWVNSGEHKFLRRAEATLSLTVGVPTDPVGPPRRSLRPGPADWRTIALPTELWWLYRAVRPVRIAASRLGLPTVRAEAPFLSTPEELVDPLLALVAPDRTDVLVDLGCGDGRLVIGAAERIGCRSIGVEHSRTRVDLARRRAADSPAADLIEIREGDAPTADLSDVTVVVMFLPIEMVAETVGDLLSRLPAGARVLAHEQVPLPAGTSPRPQRSVPVVGRAALTVAHVWTAP